MLRYRSSKNLSLLTDPELRPGIVKRARRMHQFLYLLLLVTTFLPFMMLTKEQLEIGLTLHSKPGLLEIAPFLFVFSMILHQIGKMERLIDFASLLDAMKK